MTETYQFTLLRTEFGTEANTFVFSALADENELFQLTLEMPISGTMDEQIATAFEGAAEVARALAEFAEAKSTAIRGG